MDFVLYVCPQAAHILPTCQSATPSSPKAIAANLGYYAIHSGQSMWFRSLWNHWLIPKVMQKRQQFHPVPTVARTLN